jgi:hypothetical protein
MSHGGSNEHDVIKTELTAHSSSHSHSADHHSSGHHSSGHHSSESMASQESPAEGPKGCVWDKSGCINELCDEEAMENRCTRLNHDKDQCEGELGQLNRCQWYHGPNYNTVSKHKSVLAEEEVELEAMSSNDGHHSHSNSHSVSHSNAHSASHSMSHDSGDSIEIQPRLGCIWDQTGCSNGCDMEAMDKRCDRMSHDQEMCEGEIGQFNRCQWSHGGNVHSMSNLNVDVNFSDFGEDSTLDILLIIAGVVTAVFIIQQFYRWWKNREYKKVRDTQHHEEIQITSHAI